MSTPPVAVSAPVEQDFAVFTEVGIFVLWVFASSVVVAFMPYSKSDDKTTPPGGANTNEERSSISVVPTSSDTTAGGAGATGASGSADASTGAAKWSAVNIGFVVVIVILCILAALALAYWARKNRRRENTHRNEQPAPPAKVDHLRSKLTKAKQAKAALQKQLEELEADRAREKAAQLQSQEALRRELQNKQKDIESKLRAMEKSEWQAERLNNLLQQKEKDYTTLEEAKNRELEKVQSSMTALQVEMENTTKTREGIEAELRVQKQDATKATELIQNAHALLQKEQTKALDLATQRDQLMDQANTSAQRIAEKEAQLLRVEVELQEKSQLQQEQEQQQQQQQQQQQEQHEKALQEKQQEMAKLESQQAERVKNLTEEVAALRSRIEQTAQEKKTIEDKKANMEAKLFIKDADHKRALEKLHKQHKQQFEAHEEQMRSLIHRHNQKEHAFKQTRDQFAAEMESVEEHIAGMDKRAIELRNQLYSYQEKRIEDDQKRIEDAEEKRAEAQARAVADFGFFEVTAKGLQDLDTGAVYGDAHENADPVEVLTSALAHAQQEKETLQTQKEALQARLNGVESDLKGVVAEYEREVTAYRAGYEEVQEKHEKETEKLTQELALAAEEEMRKAQGEAQEVYDAYEALTAQSDELESALTESKQALEQVKTEKAVLQKDIDDRANLEETAKQELTSKQEELLQSKSEKRKLEEDLNNLRVSFEKASAGAQKKEKELRAQKQIITNATEVQQKLAGELDHARTQLKTSEMQILELQTKQTEQSEAYTTLEKEKNEENETLKKENEAKLAKQIAVNKAKLEKQIEVNEAKLDVQRVELETLQRQYNDREKNISKARDLFENQSTALQKENRVAQDQINELRGKLVKIKDTFDQKVNKRVEREIKQEVVKYNKAHFDEVYRLLPKYIIASALPDGARVEQSHLDDGDPVCLALLEQFKKDTIMLKNMVKQKEKFDDSSTTYNVRLAARRSHIAMDAVVRTSALFQCLDTAEYLKREGVMYAGSSRIYDVLRKFVTDVTEAVDDRNTVVNHISKQGEFISMEISKAIEDHITELEGNPSAEEVLIVAELYETNYKQLHGLVHELAVLTRGVKAKYAGAPPASGEEAKWRKLLDTLRTQLCENLLRTVDPTFLSPEMQDLCKAMEQRLAKK